MKWRCYVCGQPAVCFGVYEGQEFGDYSCGLHCGHGNEDGRCVPIDTGRELEFSHASGECACRWCGELYYDHPRDRAFPFLRILCSAELVKL